MPKGKYPARKIIQKKSISQNAPASAKKKASILRRSK
jgi:hypothetical protein